MVSIVIVNWNAGGLLEGCVRSLREHAPGCEIIIVDNASDDESCARAEQSVPGLTVCRQQRNLGFAAAANIGWRCSSGGEVLFLNPDTECLPGSVRALSSALQASGDVWAAGGNLVDPDGASQAAGYLRRFPTVQSVAAEMLLLDELWPSHPWNDGYGELPTSKPSDVDQPAGACLMIRRDRLELVDGFDERFRTAWFEDVDLCKRIRDLGGRIVFQPEARFVHAGGYSLDRLPYGRFLETFHANQARYFAKHHGPVTAARVHRWVRAGLRLRAVISLIRPLARGLGRSESARVFWNAARRVSQTYEAGS